MTGTDASVRADSDTPTRPPWVARRRYLIDRKRQLRTALLTTSLVAILLVMINIGFGMLRASQTSYLEAAAPQLSEVLERQDLRFMIAMIVISVLLLTAVAVATVMQTHRTAGAVFALSQRLERLRDGDLEVRLKLRQRDNLQDLEAPFNEMVAAIRNRAATEAAALDELAEKASRIGPEAGDLEKALREMAQDKRPA